MRAKQLELLKKIMTFDFFNLFDKEEFDRWLSENKSLINVDVFQFGNLNRNKNRKQLYQEIIVQRKIEFDEKSHSNSKHILNVLKKYCTKYLEKDYSENELCRSISFFYGNCEIEFFDKIDSKISKIFWDLHEFTEFNEQELKNWNNQIIRECKNLIKEIDK